MSACCPIEAVSLASASAGGMRHLLLSLALAALPCARAQILPAYSPSSTADAQTWARLVLTGRSLGCVYIEADAVDSLGNSLARVDASSSAGRAIRTALQSVRRYLESFNALAAVALV